MRSYNLTSHIEISSLMGEDMSTDSIAKQKSMAFSIRIVRLYQYLRENHKEYVMSKQILRSGTSIGANTRESRRAQSNADFITKLHIAFKEAEETAYWLEILHATEYITDAMFESLNNDCEELIKLLSSIIKSSKQRSPLNS